MGLGSQLELIFKAVLDRSDMASGLRAIEGQVQTFAGKIKNLGIASAIGTELTAGGKAGVGGLMSSFGALVGVGTAIGASVGVAMNAVNGLSSAIASSLKAFEQYEQATLQIARFTGSMEEARKKMEELDKLGESLSTPDEQLADAYQTLRLIGGEAMATASNIRLIADASNAGRGGIDELARSFAIVSSMIESGEGIGKWGTKLARAGVISFEAKDAIDKLSKSVETQGEAMAIFTKEWEKFAGASEMKGRTFSGAMERVKDSVGDLMKEFAKPMAGTFGNDLRDLADLIKDLEPIANMLGKAIASIGIAVNAVSSKLQFASDGLTLLREAMTGDWEGFDARIARIGKRFDNLGRATKSITSGTMETEDPKKMKEEKYDVDTEGTTERINRIRKLYEDIKKIRSESDQMGLTEGEKLLALDEQRRMKAEEIAKQKPVIGRSGTAEAEEIVLNLKKEQLGIELEMQKIVMAGVREKQKSAEAESKKAGEIYKEISEGQKKREFNNSTPVEQLKTLAGERRDLAMSQDTGGIAGVKALDDKRQSDAGLKKYQDRKANLEAQQKESNRISAETGEKPKDFQPAIKEMADVITRQMKIVAENDEKVSSNKLGQAETAKKIYENNSQTEDIKKTQAKDLKSAQGETADYNTNKMLTGLREDQGSPEGNKKAIALEKAFHDARIKQIEEEVKKLKESGDLAGAEKKQLEAEKEKDMNTALTKDSRKTESSQGTLGGSQASAMGASLLGIQYDTSAQEQVKHLSSIEGLTKTTNEAIKKIEENTSKPVVVTKFQ